jgi:hypothetical protein
VRTGQEAVAPPVQRVESLQQDEQLVGGGVQARRQLGDRVGPLLDRRVELRKLGGYAIVNFGTTEITGCE